jgi:hypothetical protein
MRKPLVTSSFVLLGTLLILVSCSDKSTQPNMTTGNANDLAFTMAKNDAVATVSEFSSTAKIGGRWLNWHPGLFNFNVGDSVSYDSTTGWHVFSRSFMNDNRQFAVSDSFRFTALDGMFQFQRDSTTNVFEQKLSKSSSLIPNPDMPGVTRSRLIASDFRWVGLADSVTTLNGTFHRHSEGSNQVPPDTSTIDSMTTTQTASLIQDSGSVNLHHDEDVANNFFGDEHNFFSDEDGMRQFTRDIQGQFNNVQFHTDDLRRGEHPQPYAGTLVEQITLNIVTPNRTINLMATVTIDFSHNGFHGRMEGDNRSWEWDDLFGDIGL